MLVDYLERPARDVTITARLTRRDRELVRVAADAVGASISSFAAAAVTEAARRELRLETQLEAED